MELSGEQRKKLQKALLNAFPSKFALKKMLCCQLEKNLDEISGGDNLGGIVFQRIETAEAENWIEELINAARRENHRNKALKEFSLEIKAQKEKSIQNQTEKIPESNNIPTTAFQRKEARTTLRFGRNDILWVIWRTSYQFLSEDVMQFKDTSITNYPLPITNYQLFFIIQLIQFYVNNQFLNYHDVQEQKLTKVAKQLKIR